MSVHVLQVPSRDVAAEALGLLLGAPAPAALAELVLADDRGGRLVLGVLGASHVVTASRPGAELVEQVSCDALAGGGERLPTRKQTGGYRLSTDVRALPAADVDTLAARLRAAARSSPAWICGAFPGADSALTALTGAAQGAGWQWRTWHVYPGRERGVVVATRSRWTP